MFLSTRFHLHPTFYPAFSPLTPLPPCFCLFVSSFNPSPLNPMFLSTPPPPPLYSLPPCFSLRMPTLPSHPLSYPPCFCLLVPEALGSHSPSPPIKRAQDGVCQPQQNIIFIHLFSPVFTQILFMYALSMGLPHSNHSPNAYMYALSSTGGPARPKYFPSCPPSFRGCCSDAWRPVMVLH